MDPVQVTCEWNLIRKNVNLCFNLKKEKLSRLEQQFGGYIIWTSVTKTEIILDIWSGREIHVGN